MRKMLLLFFCLFIFSVKTFAFWDLVVQAGVALTGSIVKSASSDKFSDQVNAALNISSETDLISNKSASEIRKSLYQTKRFTNNPLLDTAYSFVSKEVQAEFKSYAYISDELETIIGVDYIENGLDWVDEKEWSKTNLKDLFKQGGSDINYSDETLKKNTALSGFNLSKDMPTNSAEQTQLSVENLMENNKQTDLLGQLAGSLDTLVHNDLIEKEAEALETQKDEMEAYSDHKIILEKINALESSNKFSVQSIINNSSNKYNVIKNLVLPMHQKYGLVVICFIIGCLFTFVQTQIVKKDGIFPLVPLLIQLIIVILFISLSDQIFLKILWGMDQLSSVIFPKDNPIESFVSENFSHLSYFQDEQTKFKIKYIPYYIGIFLIWVSRLTLTIVRDLILLLLYFSAPFIASLSLIPVFGSKLLSKLIVNFVQISSWVVFKSFFFLMFTSIFSNIFDSVPSLIFFPFFGICCFFIVAFIPKLSSQWIGGGDLSMITAAASVSNVFSESKSKFGGAKSIYSGVKSAGGGVKSIYGGAVSIKQNLFKGS